MAIAPPNALVSVSSQYETVNCSFPYIIAISRLQAFARAASSAWNVFPYLFPSTPKPFPPFKIYRYNSRKPPLKFQAG